jgi:hypothetical protein
LTIGLLSSTVFDKCINCNNLYISEKSFHKVQANSFPAMAMHMPGMSNQGMMNLTPLQQQQLLQQQQQQQQQATTNNNPQPMLQHQQQAQPVPNQQVATNPNMPNPAAPNPAEQQKLDHVAKVKTLLWPLKESLIVI